MTRHLCFHTSIGLINRYHRHWHTGGHTGTLREANDAVLLPSHSSANVPPTYPHTHPHIRLMHTGALIPSPSYSLHVSVALEAKWKPTSRPMRCRPSIGMSSIASIGFPCSCPFCSASPPPLTATATPYASTLEQSWQCTVYASHRHPMVCVSFWGP